MSVLIKLSKRQFGKKHPFDNLNNWALHVCKTKPFNTYVRDYNLLSTSIQVEIWFPTIIKQKI